MLGVIGETFMDIERLLLSITRMVESCDDGIQMIVEGFDQAREFPRFVVDGQRRPEHPGG